VTQVAGPRQTQALGHKEDTSATFSRVAQVDLKQQRSLCRKGASSSRCCKHTMVGNFFQQASLEVLVLWSVDI